VSFIAPVLPISPAREEGKAMIKARKALLLAGASVFAILVSAAAVNAETPGQYDFLVAVSGKYEVIAFGASGGSTQSPGAVGGLGAEVEGELFLTAGQHLTLFVGGMGANGVSAGVAEYGGGGGGGSFIFLGSGTSDLLVAASGGGGAGFFGSGGPGLAGQAGGDGIGVSGAPGGSGGLNGLGGGPGAFGQGDGGAAPD
jgi:Glycine rich protein